MAEAHFIVLVIGSGVSHCLSCLAVKFQIMKVDFGREVLQEDNAKAKLWDPT